MESKPFALESINTVTVLESLHRASQFTVDDESETKDRSTIFMFPSSVEGGGRVNYHSTMNGQISNFPHDVSGGFRTDRPPQQEVGHRFAASRSEELSIV